MLKSRMGSQSEKSGDHCSTSGVMVYLRTFSTPHYLTRINKIAFQMLSPVISPFIINLSHMKRTACVDTSPSL